MIAVHSWSQATILYQPIPGGMDRKSSFPVFIRARTRNVSAGIKLCGLVLQFDPLGNKSGEAAKIAGKSAVSAPAFA